MLGIKPNKKHEHVYAIIRYDAFQDQSTSIDSRITVKKVVSDADHAEREVKRLNELNKDKGSYYFSQVTRFEELPADVQALPREQWAATEQQQA